MDILTKLKRTVRNLPIGRKEGENFQCIRCGGAFDRPHQTCPDCGGDFVAPVD